MYSTESRNGNYHNRSHRGGNSSNSNNNINNISSNAANANTTGSSTITPPQPRGLATSQSNNGTMPSGSPTTNGATSSASSPATANGLPFQPPRPRTASPRSPEDYTPPFVSASPAAVASANDTRKCSGLEDLVRENNLIRTIPVRELRQLPGSGMVRVGFDGNLIIDRLTKAVNKRDPLAVFTCTVPTALYDELDSMGNDISSIASKVSGSGGSSASSFEPVFVFDGISLSPNMDPAFTSHPSPPNEILPFLNCLGRADEVPANVRDLVADRFRCYGDLESYIMSQLSSRFKDVFRAPYHAWAQLSSFLAGTNRYISEVCGCLELLAFPGIDRVIVSYNASSATVDIVERAAVLQVVNQRLPRENHLTERDFSYWVMSDTVHRGFRQSFMKMPVEEAIRTLSQSDGHPERGRGFAFSKSYTSEQFQLLQANYAILDAPVLTHDATCLPLYTVHGIAPYSSLPMREAFGSPLPVVLYYCQFSGHITPQTLASVSQGTMVDRWPLIDSAPYRHILQLLLILRFQSCFQLMQVAHTLQPPSMWYREYMQSKGQQLEKEKWSPLRRPENLGLGEWDIVGLHEVVSRPQLYFSDVLTLASRSIACSSDHTYTNVEETVASILLKCLDQLGYFTHIIMNDPNLGETQHGEMSVCSQALAHITCETLGEYGVLLIELLRTQGLDDNPIHVTPHPTTQHYQPAYPRGVRFAARLLSIVHINVRGAWSGPFDPEMAAFSSISRAVSRTLRQVIEALTVTTFCTHRTEMPLSQIGEVWARLPFSLPTEFAAGHVMMYALQQPQCTMEDLERVFPECYTLRDDLVTLFGFWCMSYQAIKKLLDEVELDREMLRRANELVCDTALRLDAVAFSYLQGIRNLI